MKITARKNSESGSNNKKYFRILSIYDTNLYKKKNLHQPIPADKGFSLFFTPRPTLKVGANFISSYHFYGQKQEN